MTQLTLADVQNGKAVPQRGDMVGGLCYTGGDPSDLECYRAPTGAKPLTGSIFDLDEGDLPAVPQPASQSSGAPSAGGAQVALNGGGAAAGTANSPAGNGPLTTWPVPGSRALNPGNTHTGEGNGAFGPTRNGGTKVHTGVDFTAPVGTPVVAAGNGVVVSTTPDPNGYGNQVVIDHGNGLYTQYGHLGRIDVKPGDKVQAHNPVGLSGRTGNVPTYARPHLHFEVRTGSPRSHKNGGTVVDPISRLPQDDPYDYPVD